MHIMPSTVVGAFAEGEILQVLFFAILFAFALYWLGEKGKPLLRLIDQTAHVFFRIVGIIMKVAPIGAFGAMAFTIGKYGVGTPGLARLSDARFYATCLIFVFVRARAWSPGSPASRSSSSSSYIKEELLIVLGTSLLGVGAAAHDRQDGECWAPTSRSSGWSSRPATRSTSTAPAST